MKKSTIHLLLCAHLASVLCALMSVALLDAIMPESFTRVTNDLFIFVLLFPCYLIAMLAWVQTYLKIKQRRNSKKPTPKPILFSLPTDTFTGQETEEEDHATS